MWNLIKILLIISAIWLREIIPIDAATKSTQDGECKFYKQNIITVYSTDLSFIV